MTESKIDVDGVGVAIRDEGPQDARPLVFLHGGGRTLADWILVTPELVEDFRIVSVDFRGHGESDPVDSYSWEDGITDCAGVVEALALNEPVIIGHSLGGMTAARYAANGGKCAAVVNVDGFGAGHPAEFVGYEEEDAKRRLDGFGEESEKMFRAAVDVGDEAWMESGVAKMKEATEKMGLEWSKTEPLVRRGYRQLPDGRWQTSPSADVNSSMYRSLKMVDHWSGYKKLTVPTLVIRGMREEPQDDKDGGKFLAAYRVGIEQNLAAEQARRGDQFRVEGFDAGHMVMWEKPVELAASIRRFVEAL